MSRPRRAKNRPRRTIPAPKYYAIKKPDARPTARVQRLCAVALDLAADAKRHGHQPRIVAAYPAPRVAP